MFLSEDPYDRATMGQIWDDPFTAATMGYTYTIEITPIFPVDPGIPSTTGGGKNPKKKKENKYCVKIILTKDGERIEKEFECSSNEEPKAYDFNISFDSQILEVKINNPKIKIIDRPIPTVKLIK